MATRKHPNPHYEVWTRHRACDALTSPELVYDGYDLCEAFNELRDRCSCIPESEAVALKDGKLLARGGTLELRDGEHPLTAEECHE